MTPDELRFLGLMRRAGKLEIGEAGVKKAAAARKAKCILLASDASANAEKRAMAFAAAAGAPLKRLNGTKTELSDALGSSAAAIYAICDEGFYRAFEKKQNRTERETGSAG